MSLQFNDVANRKGLVQGFERECGYDNDFIANSETMLKDFCADVNLAMDDYLTLALKSCGRYQVDDSNHEDYSIIYTNLAQGQDSYTFKVDEDGNLILDIYAIFVRQSPTGEYVKLTPFDMQSDDDAQAINSGTPNLGVPVRYDKTGNAYFFDPIADFDSPDGIKLMVSREGKYFVYTDTTKMPGFPGIHHRYFYIKPAMEQARRNQEWSRYDRLKEEVKKFEEGIVEYFGQREKDEPKKIISARQIEYR
jgi:hypothetical protein